MKSPDWKLLLKLFRRHPWHGVSAGEEAPEVVSVYVEIVPTDTVKYEIDKATGYLEVDRPQRFSNVCPSLYGFIPRTYCAERVAGITMRETGYTDITGDGDALDICVLTEKTFSHGDVFARARPVGGFRMIDGDEADDKILAVLEGDVAFGGWTSIDDVPEPQIERLEHYFLTYKQPPRSAAAAIRPADPEGDGPEAGREGREPEPGGTRVEITHVYGREEAHEVIRASREDYRRHFPQIDEALADELGRADGETGDAG